MKILKCEFDGITSLRIDVEEDGKKNRITVHLERDEDKNDMTAWGLGIEKLFLNGKKTEVTNER